MIAPSIVLGAPNHMIHILEYWSLPSCTHHGLAQAAQMRILTKCIKWISRKYGPGILFKASNFLVLASNIFRAVFRKLYTWLLFEDEGWRIRKKINWWLVTTTLLVFFLSVALIYGVVNLVMIMIPVSITISYLLVLNAFSSSVIQWSILILIDSVMVCPTGTFNMCWNQFCISRYIAVGLCFRRIGLSYAFPLSYGVYVWRVKFFPWNQHYTCVPAHRIIPGRLRYLCNIVINIYTTCTSLSCNLHWWTVVMSQTSCSGI